MERGGGGSRLLQMQARFQQKQMQEREMKIASLYEAQQARALDRVRHSPSNGVSNGNSSMGSPPQAVPHQPGKVRQMFEERRTKAGIDKSYPLQPIHNSERVRKALPNGYTKVTAGSVTNTRVTEKRIVKTKSTHSAHAVNKYHNATENVVNGSGDLNHNHEPDLNSLNKPLPQNNGEPMYKDQVDNNYMLENETFPEALAPVPTPRSPEPAALKSEPVPPPRRSPATRTSPAKTKIVNSPRRVTSDNTVSDVSKSRGMQKKANSTIDPIRVPAVIKKSSVSSNPTTSTGSPRKRGPVGVASTISASSAVRSANTDDTRPCSVCSRRFAPDRLAKHEEICRKAQNKKRKPFDALKHRLAGTEAEPFISKLRKNPPGPSSTKVNKPLNSTWRQKHQEFINAIRAAKQVQAHLNAGGKLSDLPPPPPSENPDYVQCPHCNRRFNQAAAERHIPKCKDFQFNKPKPGAKKR